MAKIVIVSLYKPEDIGTRLLIAYLHKNGHQVHNIHLKSTRVGTTQGPLVVEEHRAFQVYLHGEILRFDFDVAPITLREVELLEKTIRIQQPDILGLSAESCYDFLAPTLLPIFKRAAPEALLACGGYGPTLQPELYLDAGFDVVIRGDGEEALLDLANNLENTKKCMQIQNTSYKNNDTYIHNPVRPQEKNISKYPHPLFGNEHYSFIEENLLQENFDTSLQKKLYFTLLGRGCTGKCTYCSSSQWTNLYKRPSTPLLTTHVASPKRRNRRIEDILTELSILDKTKVKEIIFEDDFFAMSRSQTKEFFMEYKKFGLPFFLYLNYEMALNNRDLFEIICDAGFKSTSIGIQHGSEEFAEKFYNRKPRNDTYLEYAKLIFENNIVTGYAFIGGNCYETEEYFKQNLDYIKQLPFSLTDPLRTYFWVPRLTLFPHAPIIERAPKVLTHPMSAQECFYRAFLMEFRRILDDDAFEELRTRKEFKNDLPAMQKHFKKTLRTMQQNYFIKLSEELENKPLVFYGAGELYQVNKHLFASLKPAAMLINKEYTQANCKHIDGIPVVCLEDFMCNKPDITVITFSNQSTWLQRNLVRKYNMKNQDIHTCTSVLSPETM